MLLPKEQIQGEAMQKSKMHTPDITDENIKKITTIFPNCVTEIQKNGGVVRAIDFDQLKQELSKYPIVDGLEERYQLNWPGKHDAFVLANSPISKTLRPCRDESINFDNTKNLFIEGDNLEALKLLQETYLNKIRMIYIDPPYNTGNDYIYKDDFSKDNESYSLLSNQKNKHDLRMIANTEANGRFHSDWLSMMYPRLKLARNLLRDDGIIFISIDDNEVMNLRKLCDEIFGADNFVANLIWKKKYGGGAKTKYYVGLHEYILCYSKNKTLISNIEMPYKEENRKYYKYEDEKILTRGPYRLQPLNTNSNDLRKNLIYPIAYKNMEIWPEGQWQWSKERADLALQNNELVITKTKDKYTVNFKQYLLDEDGTERKSKPFTIIDGIYTQHGTLEIKELFGNGKIFSFPKPSSLLIELIKVFSGNDLILDFFSGSSSTAHAILQQNLEDGGNRRFIMVQNSEPCNDKSEAFKYGYKTIAEIGKERIRRAGKKILEENTEKKDIKKLDIGFRVLKIDDSNMNEVYYSPNFLTQNDLPIQINNVCEDRTPEDLLFQVLLDWGVDLTLPITKKQICSKEIFFVTLENSNKLVACFDMGITEKLIKELATYIPEKIVFRDAGFETDSLKINVEQIFKHLSPDTEIRVL